MSAIPAIRLKYKVQLLILRDRFSDFPLFMRQCHPLTWGTVEILVVVVLFYNIHSAAVLLAGLVSAQQADIISIQHNKREAGGRAEVVGVCVAAPPGSARAAPAVRRAAVELRPQQLAPAEVVELVVSPHVVDLHGARAELSQHRVQGSVRGVVALVKAVDNVAQLEDEVRLRSRL